jgi:quercetin dioxygenase-like cupin family protein
MHYVGTVDWTFVDRPLPDEPVRQGVARQVLIGAQQGAVHTELAAVGIHPGGFLAHHVHSFEEALYVLQGELLLEVAGQVHHLAEGDYGLMTVGTRHALACAGDSPVRLLSVNTPQRLAPDAGRQDTFFDRRPFDLEALRAAAQRPPFGDPRLRFVGHYLGTPPQAEALRLEEPARGRRPAGMDTALLAYSGISVKMLVDRGFGADLLTMFTVDYEIGGAAQAHDHPFEETYFFTSGVVEAELDGKPYTLRAGDVVFAGVSSVHGFWNDGSERVRWIETQAPQPPTRHSYRWVASWKKLESEGS